MRYLYIDNNKFSGTIHEDFTAFLPNLCELLFILITVINFVRQVIFELVIIIWKGVFRKHYLQI